jgi:N-acetylneuraminate synthase/sialic acid synthase
MTIGSRRISDDTDCYVIAEIGHNHQGELEKCKALFRAAHEAGADAVKLQKRDNRSLYTRAMYEQPYNSENAYGTTYGAHREYLEFGREEYGELKSYARELGITFFSTAFDFASADFLADLDMPAFKVASGDLKNIPLIEYIAKLGKPMIVSTGGGDMSDVRRAHDAVIAINPQLCVMQCTAVYPAEAEQLNLRVIETFRREFPDVVVGLSAHDNGISLPVVGYVLGARVIEKHFTLNRAWKGTDHALSLAPDGMRRLVRDLHRARSAFGDGIKRPLPEEGPPITKMGKKLVAARALAAGHKFTRDDIAIKSPGDGVPPYEIDRVIGRTLTVNLACDDGIRLEQLKA